MLGHNRANNHSSGLQRTKYNVNAQERLQKDKFRFNSVNVSLSARLACRLKILSFRTHVIHKFMVNVADSAIIITE